MVISLDNLLVNKVEVTLGGKSLTAEYTHDADERFQELMLNLGNLEKRLEADDVEDMAYDEQKEFAQKINDEEMALGREYIASLFNDEDTETIMAAINNRSENLANIVYYLNQLGDASSDEHKAAMEKPNRQAKRTNDHKKGKKN